MTNRFLPSFNQPAQHDTPGWALISPTGKLICNTIAQALILQTAVTLNVGMTQKAALTINGRRCTVDGAYVFAGWYLAETADHETEKRDKFFYLLPSDDTDFPHYGDAVPAVRSEDVDFDANYESQGEERMVRLYILCILAKLVHG